MYVLVCDCVACTMNRDMKLFTVSFRNQDKLFIRACMVQWNLVNTNTVKAKSLLNTNHFEIPRHYITLIQLVLLMLTFCDGPLEFILS